MSKLDDIMTKFAAYCDQSNREIEYDTSDNYDFEVAKDQIKTLIRDLIDETFDKDDAKALELWQKIEAL